MSLFLRFASLACLSLAFLANICLEGRTQSQELVLAMDEWKAATTPLNAIAYEFHCETPTQVITGQVTANKNALYIVGNAVYRKNMPEKVDPRYAPAFTGRFAIYKDDKRMVRHLIEEWTRYESADLVLPASVAVGPQEWLECPALGNLCTFATRITSDKNVPPISRLSSDQLSVSIQRDSGEHSEFIFTQQTPFHLKSYIYEPPTDKRDAVCTYKGQFVWQKVGGQLVPERIENWQYNGSASPKQSVRLVTFKGYTKSTVEGLSAKLAEAQMPQGTLLMDVTNGIIKRRFVGGEAGKVEYGLRNAAFELRRKNGEFTVDR